MKVVECGTARWHDHGLDYPHEMVTTNFKITGDGHRRIESIYTDCCHDRTARELLDDKQPDHRIGAWLSRHACSFVLLDTQPRFQAIVCAGQTRSWHLSRGRPDATNDAAANGECNRCQQKGPSEKVR